MISKTDESLLVSYLTELRGNARMTLSSIKLIENPDAAAIVESVAVRDLRPAHALHRLLDSVGIRGLGPAPEAEE